MIARHVWLGVALLINGRAIGLGAGLVINGRSILLRGDCLFLLRDLFVLDLLCGACLFRGRSSWGGACY